MRNARLDEAQAEIPEKLPGEISITLDMQMIPSSWQKAKRNWRTSDERERREWQAGLKLNIQKTKIMASGPIISWQIDGETMETVTDFILGGSKITVDSDWSHEIKRRLLLWRKEHIKSRDITLLTKVCLVKVMVFPVVMCECESWTIKKAECWRIDVFELWHLRRLLSPLDCKIKPVNPKVNQSRIFIGRTDAKAGSPILWPPDAKTWLIGRDPDTGKDWRQEEKGTTEDEMIEWHRRFDRHEFEYIPGVGDGLGRLTCCSPWDHKESDTTKWLKWTELNWQIHRPNVTNVLALNIDIFQALRSRGLPFLMLHQ